jgi:hypothetical protein
VIDAVVAAAPPSATAAATRTLRPGPGVHAFTVPVSGVLTLERLPSQAGGPSSEGSKHARAGMHTSGLQ